MARYPRDSVNKLNKNLIKEVVDLISSGAYIETAVAYVGITKDTFYRWLRMSKQPNPPPLIVELSDAVRRALAISELRDLQRIEAAAEHDWRVSAWRLERRFPERWGRLKKGPPAFGEREPEESSNHQVASQEIKDQVAAANKIIERLRSTGKDD